jgi:hypothetical protein
MLRMLRSRWAAVGSSHSIVVLELGGPGQNSLYLAEADLAGVLSATTLPFWAATLGRSPLSSKPGAQL